MKHIDIVFEKTRSPDPGPFVEVEDDTGKSISIGEWIDRDDRYLVLRIPYSSDDLQRQRIEQLEATLREVVEKAEQFIPGSGDDSFHEGLRSQARIARTALQSAGDTPPEDDWRVYECSLCHWKIQALATRKPMRCKICTNLSMREQTAGGTLPTTEPRKIWGELYIDEEGKAHLDCHIHSSVKFEEAETAILKFIGLLQDQLHRKSDCPLHIQEKSE